MLASEPLKPTDLVISDSLVTTDEVIKVSFALPSPPSSGGSPIISYELQMDDGMSGEFSSVNGIKINSLLTTYTVTTNVIKGRRHRFRYRAKNIVGWGPYSDDSYILAATVPDRPARPYFLVF